MFVISFVLGKRPHFCYSQWFCTDKIKKMQPCGFPLLLSKHYWKYNLESSKQKIIRLTAAVCLHSWMVLRLTPRSVGQLRLTLASTWGSSAHWVHILPQCAKGHRTATVRGPTYPMTYCALKLSHNILKHFQFKTFSHCALQLYILFIIMVQGHTLSWYVLEKTTFSAQTYKKRNVSNCSRKFKLF